ncbi:unnamed protein product, partial [Ascophyllum nodosum]
FLPIHSGLQWTYQPGSHRKKVTQDFHPPSFCGACVVVKKEKTKNTILTAVQYSPVVRTKFLIEEALRSTKYIVSSTCCSNFQGRLISDSRNERHRLDFDDVSTRL